MTKSRANWHAIAAIGIVVGAECSSLKDEYLSQLAQHGPFFWVCLAAAITVGFANSIISTKPSPNDPSSNDPSSNENQPDRPATPPPGAAH